MALQWTTTSAASEEHGVKMLIHAGSGAGKTMLCATAPRPVVISAEAGLLSLSKRNIERVYGVAVPHISYEIHVIQVTTVDQLIEAFNWFANPLNKVREHFSTICLDSITEIAEVVLANAKATASDPRQAYGTLIERMLDVIKKFRDLPGFHVYFSAKMEPAKDETSGITRFGPMMPGKALGPQLPYLFDEVFHLGIGQTQQGQKYRYLRTDQDLQYAAKDRSGSLSEIEKPDLTYLIQKITGVTA